MRFLSLTAKIVIPAVVLAAPAMAEWAPAIATFDGDIDTFYEIISFEPADAGKDELLLRVDAYDDEGWLTAVTVAVEPLSVARVPSARELAKGNLKPCPGDPPDGIIVSTRTFGDRVRQADGRLVYSLHFRWTETCELGEVMDSAGLREASGSWILLDQKSNFSGTGTTSKLIEGFLIMRQRDGGAFDTEYLVITRDDFSPLRRIPLLFLGEDGVSFRPAIELSNNGFRPPSALVIVRPFELGVDNKFGWLQLDCRTSPCAVWSVQQAEGGFSVVDDPYVAAEDP